MSVSPDVVIMTRAELSAVENRWFQKGVERGRFEQRCDDAKVNNATQLILRDIWREFYYLSAKLMPLRWSWQWQYVGRCRAYFERYPI